MKQLPDESLPREAATRRTGATPLRVADAPAPTSYDDYHRFGRTTGFDDVFERVRLHTIEWVLRRLAARTSVRTLLDVGAGEGRYLPVYRRFFRGARLIAVEVSRLASARSAARHPFAEHIVGSAEDLPVPSASVQSLVSIEVIEHVDDGRKMLAECERVLEPQGWALFSTPCGNRGSLEWWMNFLSSAIEPTNGEGIYFGKTDDPTHLRRYRSSEFASLLENAGFCIESIYFNGHCFLTLARRLEGFVNGHVDLRRRSISLANAFTRLVDSIAMVDWLLFRRVGSASTMIFVVRKGGKETA